MKPKYSTWLLAAALTGCATGKPSEPRSANSPTHLPVAEHPPGEPPCSAEPSPPSPRNTERTSVMTTDIRSFGRVLGETARAVQKTHVQLLRREGSDFESWVVYLLLAEQGAAVPRDALANDLAQRLEIE